MITQFTVGCSRTVNLGNFESIRIEAQVVIVVNEEQDFASLKDAAQVELRALMEETYANQYRKK
jgi:hypothetical protein